jgi:hypothetical protein
MFVPSYSCVLCNGDVEETTEHLFFDCPLSDRCWRLGLVDINWDLSVPFPDRMRIAKASFGNPRIFMEITLVAAWCIWSVRNGIFFDGATLSLWRWKRLLREELSLTVLRCQSSKKSL